MHYTQQNTVYSNQRDELHKDTYTSSDWHGSVALQRKVSDLIPSQGTCLSCGPDPWLGASERQPLNVSLSFSLPSPLSKNK